MKTEKEVQDKLNEIKEEVLNIFIDDNNRLMSKTSNWSLRQYKNILHTLEWVLGKRDKILSTQSNPKQQNGRRIKV